MNEVIETASAEERELVRKSWSDPVLQEFDVNEVTALDPTVGNDAPLGIS